MEKVFKLEEKNVIRAMTQALRNIGWSLKIKNNVESSYALPWKNHSRR